MIKLQRVYGAKKRDSGYSILVDRMWPRGIKKSELEADEWMKEIAPDDELRKWFGHHVEKWAEFKHKYKEQLREKTDILQKIKSLEKKHKEIVLLFAAKDTEHNNAVALKEMLDELM